MVRVTYPQNSVKLILSTTQIADPYLSIQIKRSSEEIAYLGGWQN